MAAGGTGVHRVTLSGRLVERGALRHTPVGIPILEAVLEHTSTVREAGVDRTLSYPLPVVLAGGLAEEAARWPLSLEGLASGFLAPRRRLSRTLVFHVTAFERIQTED